jgi:hypothetical protein
LLKIRILVAVALWFASCACCVGQCNDRAALTDFDRESFTSAAYGQESQITVEFLSTENCQKRMISGLTGLGAKVRYSDERVGYAIVTVPRERVLDTLDVRGVAFATVPRIHKSDSLVAAADRKVSPLSAVEIPVPKVATSLAGDGPYFAADEAGLTELRKQHPEADGRGIRVAVVDEGIDLFHPEIENVKNEKGELVPKVVDIDVVTLAGENDNWVQFGNPIETKDSRFAAANRTWTAPAEGKYRFGIYERELVLGPVGNSHTKRLRLGVGVLWDEREGRVWVDTDGDASFKNETALTDYGKSQATAFFGKKEGEDDNRIPFGIKIDKQKHAVYVTVANGGHGTHVSGPLAGNRLTGGLFDGAAPNTQLVDVVFGVTKSLSVLRAFARPDVDVVNRSGGTARYLDADREGFERNVLERAVVVYDKPIVSFSAGKNLLLVNDFVSAEMLRRNRQASPPYAHAMNSFVWFKPDGLVNTVLGPSGSLGIQSRYLPFELQWEDGRLHSYSDDEFAPPAPDGYMINSNMSPTIPVVSGILADLISEAKREHVRYSADRLYQALTTSSHLLPGFSISEQGYGVVNAAAAWDRLAKMAFADDSKNQKLTSFRIEERKANVVKEVNGFLAETFKPGEKVSGELWITREGGYAAGRSYRLALRANEGAFTLLDSKARLVQGKAAKVRFRAVSRPKWSMAFLQLIDEKTSAVMQEVPLSIRAPDVPTVIAPGVEQYQATTPPRHEEYGYVELGDDVQAARFQMRIPYEGPEGISGRHLPPRLSNPHNPYTPAGEPVDAANHVGPLESLESLFANTKPGIQQFYWENRGSHAEYETPYDQPPAATVPITGTVTVTKYSVAVTKTGDRLNWTNQLADIEGRVEIYEAKISNSHAEGQGSHASVDLPRSLPAHLSQWRISIGAPALSGDAADLFLLNCTNEKDGCFVAAQKAVGAKSSVLTVDAPKEGNWRVVVRTRDSVNGPQKYEIREAFLTPSGIPAETTDSKHASGATWSVALPAKQSDAQYAAFHIAGTPGTEGTQNDGAKNGVRIALTPLDSNAP